jgi:hypothetical protein
MALLLGAVIAFVVVPPIAGFYWGWNQASPASGGLPWNPWVTALGKLTMSWLIYPAMLVEGDAWSTPEGRSAVIGFVAATLASSLAVFPWLKRRRGRG